MKLTTIILLFSLVICVKSQDWLRDSTRFVKEAGQGTRDMWRAYRDMREANFKNSDKYFHARGNYDAARRGPGGVWAAKVISNAREFYNGRIRGRDMEDLMADRFANEWGRSGKDPNHFRPPKLPLKY